MTFMVWPFSQSPRLGSASPFRLVFSGSFAGHSGGPSALSLNLRENTTKSPPKSFEGLNTT